MRTKFNTHFSQEANRTEMHGSYLQNYLKSEIDALLAPSANQITQVDFDEIYIHNEFIEAQLQEYTHHTYTNNTCIIEGLTGSGKTMLVRHVFGIHAWKAKVIDNTLIIPFSFDNGLHNVDGETVEAKVGNLFARMIHAACDCLVTEFPNLKNVNKHVDEFYDSIKAHRQDLLYSIEAYPAPPKELQMSALLKEIPLAFYSSALKFYLNQTDVCTIDNVVIVIDDIEGIRPNSDDQDLISNNSPISHNTDTSSKKRNELLPVKAGLELIECLQNKGESAIHWSLNTIICCRHYVSRMMKTLPYSRSLVHVVEGTVNYMQAIQAYAPCERIDLSESPPIIDIIRRRYYALRGKGKNSSEKWELAMSVVMELLERVDDKIISFITDLTLQNNREAMKLIKQVVLNRRWVQREIYPSFHESPGAFMIQDINQFHATPVSLIRAIGMNESDIYHSQESLIPNLLHNEQNPEVDLFPLLTLKYFLQMSGNESMDWHSFISITDFYAFADDIFSDEIYNASFRSSIKFLLMNRLLLRSYDQDQVDNYDLNLDTLDVVERVYVSKLAVDLWNRLRLSSVFMEMYMDDIWVDEDFPSSVRVSKYSQKSYYSGFDTENFEMSLDYLKYLIFIEHSIYQKGLTNRGLKFDEIRFDYFFGSQSICSHLLRGLENSLNAYYKPMNREYYIEDVRVERWRSKISELKEASKISNW